MLYQINSYVIKFPLSLTSFYRINKLKKKND